MAYMSHLGIWGLGAPFREFSDFIQAVEKRYYINYVIHWPIRWHWENGNQELAYIRGHRLRAILKTEDTVFPKTDIPGLVNSIFKCF